MNMQHLDQACRVCDNKEKNIVYEAREMMFGMREKFVYFQCGRCQCLQIATFPENIGKYYPSEYASFQKPGFSPAKGLLSLFNRWRMDLWLRGYRVPGKQRFPLWLDRCLGRRYGLKTSSRILDVGCGEGHLLIKMQHLGFTDLTGVDPYISSDTAYGNGLKIYKREIADMQGSYDLIMLNHSFEHLPDPHLVLKFLRERISENGVIMLRIPVILSFAWRTYKMDWFQIDAPRHFFLHSLESINILSEKAGMVVDNILFDSNAMQFFVSDMYVRDQPFSSLFCNGEMQLPADIRSKLKHFKRKAKRLNRQGDGDQACFFLKPAT